MESVYIDFEAWIDDQISICGYMDLEDAGEESPLEFFGYDGLECGSHISNTKYPSFSDDQVAMWEKLVAWFSTTDVVQYLVDFAEESKKLLFAQGVELYINRSKLDGD